ncbi:MAG: transcriptional regulator, MarR family [Betaproteobacteria bacterium]|nr:transcriptional regulator, MarR family [Betaproteobacteria bacterium]
MKSSLVAESEYALGCTCFYLRSATRRATQVYDEHLQAAGLTVNQYSLLSKLSRNAGVSVSRFAEVMSMDRTTLTRNLQPLQAAGWLTAVAAGRSRALALTAAGEVKLAEAIPLWQAAQEKVNQVLGPQTQRELHRSLKASIKSLEAEHVA